VKGKQKQYAISVTVWAQFLDEHYAELVGAAFKVLIWKAFRAFPYCSCPRSGLSLLVTVDVQATLRLHGPTS
jgi:hypothetical protein